MPRKYRLELTHRAAKSIRALAKPIKRHVKRQCLALTDDPRPPGCAKLRGEHDIYRIRVSDYRIIYAVDDQKIIVLIVEVGDRKEIYRIMKSFKFPRRS